MDTQLYKSVEAFCEKFPKILKEDDLLFLLSLSSFQEKFKNNNFETEDVKSFIIALSTNFEPDIFYNAIVASIKLNSDSDKSDVFIEVMNNMNDEQKINEIRNNIKAEWDNFKNGQTLISFMNLLTTDNQSVDETEGSVESISEDESQMNDLENESLFRGPDEDAASASETQDEIVSQNVAEDETQDEMKSQEENVPQNAAAEDESLFEGPDEDASQTQDAAAEDESQTNDLENESLFRGPDEDAASASETQDETVSQNVAEDESQNEMKSQEENVSQNAAAEDESQTNDLENESLFKGPDEDAASASETQDEMDVAEAEPAEIEQSQESHAADSETVEEKSNEEAGSLDESNLLNYPSENQSDDEENEKQRTVYESNLFDDNLDEKSKTEEADKSEKEIINGGKISRKNYKKGKKSKKTGGYKKFI